MAYSEIHRKHDLECVRLASNLMVLASSTLNPFLQAHCIRMAKAWSERAEQELTEDAPRVLHRST